MTTITVLTCNRPRHRALVSRLGGIATHMHVIEQRGLDALQTRTPVQQDYFEHVSKAEARFFGDGEDVPDHARIYPVRMDALNDLAREAIAPALESDLYIVFGGAHIKGWLADFLIAQGAFNLHMGIAPYYRGSACNFWAMYDALPNFVGATVQVLTHGLDSGPMLYHAVPKFEGETPFEFTMKAVSAAQISLAEHIASGAIQKFEPVKQDKGQEMRYTRNAEFTDTIASEFLARNIGPKELEKMLKATRKPDLLHPYTGG